MDMMLRVLGLDPIMGHCLVIPHANCAMQKWKILNTLFPCVQACHADLLAQPHPQLGSPYQIRPCTPQSFVTSSWARAGLMVLTHKSFVTSSWARAGLMVLTHKSFVSNLSALKEERAILLANPYPLKASVLIGQLSQRGGKKERRRRLRFSTWVQ